MVLLHHVDTNNGCICSPTGKRIDSKPQLARYLGNAIDISSFDFQKGRFIQHLPSPSISLYRCIPGSTTVTSSGNIGVPTSSIGCGISIGGGSATIPTLGGGITITPANHSTVGSNLKRKHRMAAQAANLNLSSTSSSSSSSISSHHSSILNSCTTMTTSAPNLQLKQQQLEFR